LEASNYVKENKEKFQFSEILENAIKEFWLSHFSPLLIRNKQHALY
jgi:hypothetical protein